MAIARRRRSGRPRSTTWVGELGSWLSAYTVARLAGDLDLEPSTIGRWARGDCQPQVRKAIAVVEVARAAGSDLTLEDIYKTAVERVRARARDDYQLELQKAIVLVEVARRAGMDLSLEDVYERHFARIRARIRSGHPPL